MERLRDGATDSVIVELRSAQDLERNLEEDSEEADSWVQLL